MSDPICRQPRRLKWQISQSCYKHSEGFQHLTDTRPQHFQMVLRHVCERARPLEMSSGRKPALCKKEVMLKRM